MRLTALLAFAFVVSVTVVPTAHAQWTSTNPPVLPGVFTLPLNTSTGSQSKAGPLTINGSLNIQTLFDISGPICWNGDCRNDWSGFGSGTFLHRHPWAANPSPPDANSKAQVGSFDVNISPVSATFAGANPGPSGTYGAQARAATSGNSTGIFGEAQADSQYAYGVLGYNSGLINALAGYLFGNVKVANQYDLVIGPIGSNVLTARQNIVSEVCLGDAVGRPYADVCKQNWTLSGGNSRWASASNVIYPESSVYSLTVGNGVGPFTVRQYSNLTADVRVTGSGKSTGQVVIGDPSASFGVGLTCGDGICNSVENNTIGSPNYCPADCDLVPTGSITSLNQVINSTTRQVTFSWSNPTDADFAGTKVIQAVNSPPTSPTVAGTTVPKPQTSYVTPQLTYNVQYYFAFYAYDLNNVTGQPLNYSSGLVRSIRITPPGPPPPPPPPRDGGRGGFGGGAGGG